MELIEFLFRKKRLKRLFNKKSLPRKIKIKEYLPNGCLFEISLPIEVFRIEQYGNEKEFTRMILKELTEDDIFYDIGASVGLVSIHAAKICKLVFAFEPDPSIRLRLERNVQLNSYDNLKLVEWAVSNIQDEVDLFSDGIEGLSPSICENSERSSIRVHCDTIDNALQRGEIIAPDVIKMDIEGDEVLALDGMKELLNSLSSPRTLFIEIHPENLMTLNSSAKDVIDFLKKFYYKLDFKEQRNNQIHCIFRRENTR